MSDQNDKPLLDEQALARLLEAAYVLQEHNRQRDQLERSLELQSDQLREQEQAEIEQLRSGHLPPASQQENPPLQSGPSENSAPLRPGPYEPPQVVRTMPLESSGEGTPDDYTQTLAQIVKTQHQIQVRRLDLESMMALVASRSAEIARASGAAIGILDGKNVRYRAASGVGALPVGTEVAVEKALCSSCLRTGQAIRCGDVNPEFLLDAEECQRRGIAALIAVPVYHSGEVAGALEIYFDRTQTFTEQDVHRGQLMAGLVTEAFARNEEVSWKKSLAAERATMLEALEKLRPNLAALADVVHAKQAAETGAPAKTEIATAGVACHKCGHELMAEEQFCGDCGAARVDDDGHHSLQSKLASLWNMQQAAREHAAGNGNGSHPDISQPDVPLTVDPADMAKLQLPALDGGSGPGNPPDPFLDSDLEMQIQKMIENLNAEGVQKGASQTAEGGKEIPYALPPFDPTALEELDRTPNVAGKDVARKDSPATPLEANQNGKDAATGSEETLQQVGALVPGEEQVTWSSAAKARDFLDQVAAAGEESPLARFWRARRGDVYLAVAVVLVAVVIRWGIWSNHSVGATGNPTTNASRRRPAPDSDLSFFDKLLISTGFAEAPEAPESKGNPDAQVWVDTQTALYYCQGADLYGKTPKGKFTNQRDAQLDQFEAAYRKACD